MDCPYISEDGQCQGPYKGFGCIGEKCQVDKEVTCPHLVDGYYCSRYHRFGCPGPSNCSSIDEYMEFFRKEKAQMSL